MAFNTMLSISPRSVFEFPMAVLGFIGSRSVITSAISSGLRLSILYGFSPASSSYNITPKL